MQLCAGGQRSVSQRGRPITCQYTVVTATRATIRFEQATTSIDKNQHCLWRRVGNRCVTRKERQIPRRKWENRSDSHLWQMGRLRAGELPGPPVPVGHVWTWGVQLLRQVVRSGRPRLIRPCRQTGKPDTPPAQRWRDLLTSRWRHTNVLRLNASNSKYLFYLSPGHQRSQSSAVWAGWILWEEDGDPGWHSQPDEPLQPQ